MFKRLTTFWTLLLFFWALPIQRAWSEPIYIPSLGANATGTTVGGKKTLDVSIPAGLAITDPAEGLTGAVVPTTGILVGGTDGADLQAVSVDSTGKINVNNISGTVSLPTGAANQTKQDTGNTSLSSIDGKLGSLGQKAMAGSAPVVISSDQSAIPASQSGTWNINNVSGTVSLPTGASTDSKQDTGNTSLSSIDTKASTINTSIGTMSAKLPAALGQTTSAASLSVVLASDQSTSAGRAYLTSARNSYSGVNVTTGAWVQLVASTSGITNEVEIFDSSGQTLELGTGAVAAEARVALIFPGGNGRIPLKIASGTRVSVRAVSATASAGELDINFYQ